MEEKQKKGGKRLGSGRKPLGTKKKKTISLFVEEFKIWSFGNEEKLKSELYSFIDSKHNAEQPKNATKTQETPQISIKTEIPTYTTQRTVEDWIRAKREIEDWDTQGYQQWLRELETATNLSSKQKSAIKFA